MEDRGTAWLGSGSENWESIRDINVGQEIIFETNLDKPATYATLTPSYLEIV